MKIDINKLSICPGSLKEGFSTYSPAVIRHVFKGKKVSHVLEYDPPTQETNAEAFLENRKRISISGVQEKVSMLLDGKTLRLTKEGEQGTYILKPIPRDLNKVQDVPPNEHLTMQIAEQIFKINTAKNVLIFFKDGTPAYLTKRFDIKNKNEKWGVEDFASIAGKTQNIAGENFKYDYSYLKIGELMKRYVPAFQIELERFLQIIVFNYMLSNGDAHLKNFSLIETEDTDYILSPFYDLINTRIHVSDTAFALSEGLFPNEHRSDQYLRTGYPIGKDLFTLGYLLGISEKRIKNIIEPFLDVGKDIEQIIQRSFLSEPSQRAYLLDFQTRRNQMKKIN